MMKKRVLFLIPFALFFSIACVFASPISNDLHINLQVLNSTGDPMPGTYTFTFNISSSSDCNVSNVVYSNASIITTDSRGIVSTYLSNLNFEFNQQYWLCYYRDGVLIETYKFSRAPYTFYSNDSSYLSGYAPGFFMPLNKSVFGNFDFNGGWQNNGLSIIGGNLYGQNLYFANFSNLNVSTLNINGSIVPKAGYDNQFNLGSSGLRWKDLFVGGDVYSNGSLYENGQPLSNLYYSASNPLGFIDWAKAMNGTLALQSSLANYYPYANPYGFYNSTTLPLQWSSSGSNIYYNSGQVGIGTAGPFASLTLSAKTHNDGIALLNNSVNTMRILPGTVFSGDWNPIVKKGDDLIMFSNGTMGYGNLTIAPWNSVLSGIKVLANGNVGIGTATPKNTLNVKGNANVTGTIYGTFSGNGASLTGLNAGNIGSGTLAVARGGTGTGSSTGSGSVVLSTSPTITGTLTSTGSIALSGAGNIGIGSVGTGWYSDVSNLAARFPGASGDFYVQNANGGATYLEAGAGVGGASVTGNLAVSGSMSGTVSNRYYYTSYVNASTSSPTLQTNGQVFSAMSSYIPNTGDTMNVQLYGTLKDGVYFNVQGLFAKRINSTYIYIYYAPSAIVMNGATAQVAQILPYSGTSTYLSVPSGNTATFGHGGASLIYSTSLVGPPQGFYEYSLAF